MFFDDEIARQNATLADRAIGPRSTFGEQVSAAFDEVALSDTTDARGDLLREAYGPIVDALNSSRGQLDRIYNPFTPDTGGSVIPRGTSEDEVWRLLDAARADDPGRFANLPQSREALHEEAFAPAREAIEEARRVRERADGGTLIADLIGGIGGAFTDPLNIAALPVGVSGGLLKTVLFETALGLGVESAALPAVAAFRDELGYPMTAGEMALRVGTAGAAGGVFAGVIKGTPILARQAPETTRAIARRIGRMTPEAAAKAFDKIFGEGAKGEARVARALAEDDLRAVDDSPYGDTLEDGARAAEDTADAVRAFDDGEPVPDGGSPSETILTPEGRYREGRNLGGHIERYDPAEVEVDAKTFQFKEGGDAEGVTERLQGVTEWDPVRAGLVLVYERADGKRFIADGHQRLGLAKRLQAGGQSPALYGVTLRETDGITAGDARRIAAAKNIAEGTGTAVDAAKVLREAGDDAELNLPPRSALVAQAQGLMRLSDDAFGMVINDVVRADFAAIVGRLAQDSETHSAILDVLAKTRPANQTQAESIVRQALAAGESREKQSTLFGEEELVTNLFIERAQVLDAASRRIRSDKRVMTTLVKDRARIEETGSTVKVDTAQTRAQDDAAALAMLQALANRKGALSDALTQAAKAYQAGQRSDAINGFVGAVRDAAQRGDFDGATVGRGGGAVQSGTQARSPAPATGLPAGEAREDIGADLLDALPGFDDPVGVPPAARAQAEGGRTLLDDLPDDQEVPFELELDDGTLVDRTLTVKELKADLDADDAMIERLRGCAT